MWKFNERVQRLSAWVQEVQLRMIERIMPHSQAQERELIRLSLILLMLITVSVLALYTLATL